MSTCNWPLGNGETLEFKIYSFNTNWNQVAGLYIFTYFDGQYWRALYVGQTDDFSCRMPCHDRLDEAVRRGATHIHAATIPQAAKRDNLEKMLIQHLQPPMNTHYR